MSQNIYILSDPSTPDLAQSISNEVIGNRIFYSTGLALTEEILAEMANISMTEYFYVIRADDEIHFPGFDFLFKPPKWDSCYVHTWMNSTTVRLFNSKSVRNNPTEFTDEKFRAGAIQIKDITEEIYKFIPPDIIFLSYYESSADDNYIRLKAQFPRAKRVNGINGIKEAHYQAAKLSQTGMFYVVDADAEILPSFDFSYCPDTYSRDFVHIWHSRNPVNGLEYGYGGIKLFPRNRVLEYTGTSLDFTTSVSAGIKIITDVANITRYDVTPYSTWRSAFRECVKLSAGAIKGHIAEENVQRLDTWCNVGYGEFGNFSIAGAQDGRRFGEKFIDQPDVLQLINDFNWLEKKFLTEYS